MILIAPGPAWVPRLDGTAGRYRLGRSPAGSICYPRWTARCGTQTWKYGAIMCDRFRGIRGDGRLTVSHARTLMESGQSFGKKDYIPHVHFRFCPGTRKWVKSLLRELSGRKKCGRKRCKTNREKRSLMRIVKQNRFKNLGELHKE